MAQNELVQDSTVISEDSTFVMTKSPWGAVGRSAILPGFGQFYNQSYWKIPIIWGLIGYYTYGWISSDNNYELYRQAYIDSEFKTEGYKDLRELYRDQRDLFAVYFALTYLLNLVDAYVDAHLFDFNVSEDLRSGTPQLNMRMRF